MLYEYTHSSVDGSYCEHGREIFDEEVDTPTSNKDKGKGKKKYVSVCVCVKAGSHNAYTSTQSSSFYLALYTSSLPQSLPSTHATDQEIKHSRLTHEVM